MQVSQEVDMMELSLSREISDSEVRNRSYRHLAWLIYFLLSLSLALTDVAVVGWLAKVAGAGEKG
jgi:hypothetical protein